MTSTATVLVIFLGMQSLYIAVWAVSLQLGLAWVKVSRPRFLRTLVAAAMVLVFQIAFCYASHLLPPLGLGLVTLLLLLGGGVVAVVQCVVLGCVFRLPPKRALQAWLPTIIATGCVVPVLLVVSRVALLEPFVVPTNGMAPTLLGNHWQTTCDVCGEAAYCSPLPPESSARSTRPMQVICDHFHITTLSPEERAAAEDRVMSGDRMLVAKFLQPQRWDLVVFGYPADPTKNYVQRLVGLPGETIVIKNGQVWADGKRLTLPPQLTGLQYQPTPYYVPPRVWATPQTPAVLGDDEYFMLGDFSAASLDSRYWQQGTVGRQPYAVPAANFKGVVTHIYWPPARSQPVR